MTISASTTTARRLGALVTATLLAGASALVLLSAASPTPAQADPGVSDDPIVVFAEDFENDIGTTALTLSDANGADTQYVGAQGYTYSAAPTWNGGNRCNGVITSFGSPIAPAWATTPSNSNRCSLSPHLLSYDMLRTFARGIGQLRGGNDGNHVLGNYTECSLRPDGETGPCDVDALGTGPVDGLMFGTPQLPVTPGHFYAVALDVATSACYGPAYNPYYQVQLVDAAGTATDVGPLIAPCDNAPATTIPVERPSVQGTPTGPLDVRIVSIRRGALATDGTSLSLRLYATTAGTRGNDSAIDNIRLLDATPRLDISFAPEHLDLGQDATVTFMITNTSDELAKDDLGFSATLPAGLTLSDGVVGGTCTSGTGAPLSLAGSAGGSTITASGIDLTDHQITCVVTARVTGAEGTYTVGPTDVTTTRLLGPVPATVTVSAPHVTLVTSFAAPGRSLPDDQVRVHLHLSGPTGPIVSAPYGATTSGTGAGVTPGTGTTGSFAARPGVALYLTQVGVADTDVGAYATTITCSDANQVQTGLPADAPFDGSYELTPVAGADITCTLVNTARPGDVNVAATFDDVTRDDATGVATATYTVSVVNTGAGPAVVGPLTVTPGYGSGLTVVGASWTAIGGGADGTLDGTGPFVLEGPDTVVLPGATRTFQLAITATGTTDALTCAGPATALFVSAALANGQEDGDLADNAACGAPAPVLPPPEPDPEPEPEPMPTPTPEPPLADTGSPAGPGLLGGAVLALATGVALVTGGRRRTS